MTLADHIKLKLRTSGANPAAPPKLVLGFIFRLCREKMLENDDQILACKVLTSLRCAVSESCNMAFNSEGARDKGNHGRMGIVLEKSRRLICERKFSELMLE